MDDHAAETGGVASVEDLLKVFGDLVSPVDRESLRTDLAEHLIQSERIAMANGYWGWFDDDLAFTGDWGFDPAALDVPVSVWQGRQDRFVPYTHGQWLASHLPGARAHLYDEHGHLSLALASIGAILDDLIDHAKR